MADFIAGLALTPLAVTVVLVIVFIILGFFLDINSIILITVPIIYPILLTMDINPVWFGVLVVLTAMMGNITPPVGIVVFAVGGLVRDVPLYTIFRGVWPFVLALLIAAVILIAFPQISLWLPNMMRPG